MTELERYIRENIGSFDSEPVPAGSKERFISKLNSERRRARSRLTSLVLAGLAACASILLMPDRPSLDKELERHYRRMAETESKIMALVEREYPHEKETVINTIRSITAEAIPLEEQLPDEMSMKEKSRIINEYYNHKHSALQLVLEQF